MSSYISLLTKRQKEVLMRLAEGYTNQAIADKLCIAPTTARAHLIAIYNTLGISAGEGRDIRVLAANMYRKYIEGQ